MSALAQKNPTASLTRMVKNDIRRGKGYSGLLAKVVIIRSEVTGRTGIRIAVPNNKTFY